jgi:hypothetical protein
MAREQAQLAAARERVASQLAHRQIVPGAGAVELAGVDEPTLAVEHERVDNAT